LMDDRLGPGERHRAGFVLDALEQALHDRRPLHRSGLVHHSVSQWMKASSWAA